MHLSSGHPYEIDAGPSPLRDEVAAQIWGLDYVSEPNRARIITAWTSVLQSSGYESLADVPFAAGHSVPLLRHVNEVTRTGMVLAKQAVEEWDASFDHDDLLAILILHDVDKPLLSEPDGRGGTCDSPLACELQHGVIGAMLLKELGFNHNVVSHVALHAGNAPFYRETIEALILHHADYFSADQTMMLQGKSPFYQKKR